MLGSFTFLNWASSSVWLERALDKREVGGSSPPWPTILLGGLAQLGERLICIQEVVGSIPISSTITNYLSYLFFEKVNMKLITDQLINFLINFYFFYVQNFSLYVIAIKRKRAFSGCLGIKRR